MNASFHVATPIIFKKAAISSVNIFAFQVFYFYQTSITSERLFVEIPLSKPTGAPY